MESAAACRCFAAFWYPSIATRALAEEGRDVAEAIGDRYGSRLCRWCLGYAQVYQGDLVGAAAQFGELVAEAKAAHDGLIEANSLAGQGIVLAYQGDTAAARAAADAAIEAAAELGGIAAAQGYAAMVAATLMVPASRSTRSRRPSGSTTYHRPDARTAAAAVQPVQLAAQFIGAQLSEIAFDKAQRDRLHGLPRRGGSGFFTRVEIRTVAGPSRHVQCVLIGGPYTV